MMTENEISKWVVGSAMEVHTALGPGLLENAYQECLYYKLSKNGLWVEKERPMPVYFEGVRIECGYKLDLLVEGKVVVELKAVKELNDIHLAQTISYLKLGNFKLGLLMNFNVLRLKDGIRRVVNGL
jgi:GxxExxY protein